MFLLLFLLSLASDSCYSQYVYGGIVPYDPRYAVRRPVRRSAIEALERLRLPVARYFPQVDTQVASAPFPWRPSDTYALPAQWSDDYVPSVDEDETTDYGNYEYESAYRPQPAYAEEVYPQQVVEEGNPLYIDSMYNYLMENPERPEMFESMQRRSNAADTVPLDKVLEANEKAGGSTSEYTTPGPSSSSTTQASKQQVQVTAVPASPEKKSVKSLVVPDALPESSAEESWSRDAGQKEEPLFRPLQNSQRTVWSELDPAPLSRAKNTQNKSPIPLLKQMIQKGAKNSEDAARDPLLEELTNLKKKPGV